MKLTVALVQMSMGEDPGENLRRAAALADDAAGKGAGLVVLPELFRSRYFCQVEEHRFFDLAEEIPGPSTESPGRGRPAPPDGHRRLALRAARPGPVPQHRRGHRR